MMIRQWSGVMNRREIRKLDTRIKTIRKAAQELKKLSRGIQRSIAIQIVSLPRRRCLKSISATFWSSARSVKIVRVRIHPACWSFRGRAILPERFRGGSFVC